MSAETSLTSAWVDFQFFRVSISFISSFSCLKLLQQTLGFGIGFEYFHVSLRENDHREKSGYEKKNKNILVPYLHGFKIE